MRLLVLLSAILLCNSFKVVAQDIDFLDDERVLILREDDPREFLRLARPIIKRGPQGQQQLWVRAVWAEAPIPKDFGEKTATADDRIQARRMAHELGLLREALDLELDALVEQERKDLHESFQQLLQQAEVLRQPLAASRILREHAFWLYERGEVLQSIVLQNKAAEILHRIPNVPLVERLRLKVDMAMVLDTEGQPLRARQLYQEISTQCEMTRMRALCITNAHETGLHYSASKDPKDWPVAENWFKSAIEQAQAFDDPWTVAKAEAALSRLYAQLNRYPEAIAIGHKAVLHFEEVRNNLWTGDAYKKLGAAYSGAAQHSEAIASLLKAQKLIPADYLLDQSEIHRLLAVSYEEMGDKARTIQNLKQHLAINQKLNENREAREYTKAMVDLGLQVEEERNKTLQTENAMQNQRLKDADNLRFQLMISLTMATLAIASLLLAAVRSRQLRRGELHMRRILQQIQEGILTFDAALRIRPGYSQYVEKVFGKPLKGQHILRDLIALGDFTADEIHTFEEVLTLSMSEGSLTWEFNQHLLPAEFIWQKEHILDLQWQPIFGSKGGMSSILLSFRDVTHQKELIQQVAFERLRSDRITRCLQELIQLGPVKTQRVFQDTRDFIKSFSARPPQQGLEIFRRLHTLKGLARSMGLRELAQAAHDFENIFTNHEPSTRDIEAGLERFKMSFADYTTLEAHVTVTQISSRTASSLFACLDQLLPSLRQRSEEHRLEFRGLMARDQVGHWPRSILENLEAIFMHGLNNAIDHGYLLPRQEGQTVDEVFIEVEAEEDAQGIHLTIRDYGAGIAWDKLQERAQRLGRKSLSQEQLAELVFADGLSTTETLTQTSGRGVGLSAVRSLCEELGGRVQFQPNDRARGAMLSIHWPQPRAISSSF